MGWDQNEIVNRNRQYRRLSMSRNTPPLDYQIETLSGDDWTFRMISLSPAYLDSVGRRWKDGKFCDDYRVTERK
jgi:hypothetical protein